MQASSLATNWLHKFIALIVRGIYVDDQWSYMILVNGEEECLMMVVNGSAAN